MLSKTSGKKKESIKAVNYLSKIDDEDIKAELSALTVTKKSLKMPSKESSKREKYSSFDLQDQPHGKTKEKIACEPQIAYLSSNTSVSEIRKIIRQQGNTSEDRYKILEARDRLIRLKRAKIYTLETAKVTIGTCPDMCPEKERLMREFQRQVAAYEFLDTNDYKISHEIAIKQYSRSSADQEEPLPQDLRPVSSLKMTMSYLLHEIVDLSEDENVNLAEWYHFLWDRTRGIRKDITQQELCCPDSVELIEQCARFHIVCSERLCAEELSVFDKKINTENLTKCLQTLKYMYHDLRLKGINCKNEPEFRGYIILLNLNDANFMWDLQKLPQTVQKSPEVGFALKVYFAVQSNNYAKFFRLVRETTYLNACILLRYFFQVRSKALSVMVKAYCRTTSTAYPLYELIEILGFEDENEAINFCEQAGFNLSSDEMHIVLNRQNAILPPPMINQERARTLVESKRLLRGYSIGQVIAGDQLPEKTYLNHVPHNSFDEQGYLKQEAYNAADQNGETESEETEVEEDPYEFMEEVQEEEELAEDMEEEEEIVGEEEEREEGEIDDNDPEEDEMDQEPKTKKLPSFNFCKPVSFNFSSKSQESNQEYGIFSSKNQSLNNNSQTNIFSKPNPFSLSQDNMKKSSKNIFSSTETSNNLFFKSGATTSGIFKKNEPQKTVFTSQEKQKETGPSVFFKVPPPGVFSKPPVSVVQPKIAASDTSEFQFKVPDPVKPKGSIFSAKRELDDAAKNRRGLEQTVEKVKPEVSLKEREKMIDEKAAESCEEITLEVIHDLCLTILKEECEKMKVYKRISDKLFNDLLDELIAEESRVSITEELELQKKLKEISQKVKNKITIKYYRIWRQRINKIKQQRKALDNTPVWLPKCSLEDSAKNLYSKQQEIVIKNMKKRLKNVKDFDDDGDRTFLIPVESQIYNGLKENLKSLDFKSPGIMFWKMIVSWPDLKDRILLKRHKKVMSEYFCPRNSTIDPIIKIYKPNPYETLNICLKHCEGEFDESKIISGTDGLLFIATVDENCKSVARRLTKLILSRQKLMPIPLLMIILGDSSDSKSVEPTTELKNFSDSGYLSEYTVYYEKTIDESAILKLTQTGILWLSMNKSPPVPLEMDRLNDVISNCLTDELWLRVSGHAIYNEKLTAALEDPKFIINLHNEAVTLLSDVLLEPENLMYTDFPDEFKNLLPKSVNLPFSYEYFDEDWKKEETREQIERIINSFSLPDWSFDWPVNNTMDLHNFILRYSQLVLKETNYSVVSSNIISKMYFMSNDQEIPNFVHIILEIIKEKLVDISNDIKVVYNKNHIRHFKNLPWWFKSKNLINYDAKEEFSRNRNAVSDKIEEPVIKKRRIDEDNAEISKFIENYSYIFDDDEMNNSVLDETSISDIKKTSENLDKMLLQQKLFHNLFEEKLKLALQ